MTSERELQETNRRIWAVRLKGAEEGWGGLRTCQAYRRLLPSEVVLVEYPRPGEKNCFRYLFPDADLRPEEPENLDNWLAVHGYAEVDSAQATDIYALYKGSSWIHIGRVLNANIVISKWGWEEPVFKHPLAIQPLQFDKMKFFRKR